MTEPELVPVEGVFKSALGGVKPLTDIGTTAEPKTTRPTTMPAFKCSARRTSGFWEVYQPQRLSNGVTADNLTLPRTCWGNLGEGPTAKGTAGLRLGPLHPPPPPADTRSEIYCYVYRRRNERHSFCRKRKPAKASSNPVSDPITFMHTNVLGRHGADRNRYYT